MINLIILVIILNEVSIKYKVSSRFEVDVYLSGWCTRYSGVADVIDIRDDLDRE